MDKRNFDYLVSQMDVRRGHAIFPPDVAAVLPELRSLTLDPPDMLAPVKFFGGAWTWYAAEYDPNTELFYGLVSSYMACEYGQFSLHDVALGTYRTRILGRDVGFPFERDLWWVPKTLGEMYLFHTRN